MSQKPQLSHAWILDPQKLRDNKCCCFKSLSFRVIYYAAIDITNTVMVAKQPKKIDSSGYLLVSVCPESNAIFSGKYALVFLWETIPPIILSD